MRLTYLLMMVMMLCNTAIFSQIEEVTYTMGYSTIDIKVKNDKFLTRYIAPGQEAICGFYSIYNNVLYLGNNKLIKNINEDYLYESIGKCCDSFLFDDGPRPYAMMEFNITITNVDYETNTIYAKADGADLVITTFNKEIDALYDKFYKHERLGAVKMHLILKNWDYTPESEDSYQANTSRIYKKIHFRGHKAKNTEDEQLHNVDIQKED